MEYTKQRLVDIVIKWCSSPENSQTRLFCFKYQHNQNRFQVYDLQTETLIHVFKETLPTEEVKAILALL